MPAAADMIEASCYIHVVAVAAMFFSLWCAAAAAAHDVCAESALLLLLLIRMWNGGWDGLLWASL
jgi:hypothetical protein